MVDWQAENTAVAVRADRTVQQYTAWDGVPIKITLNDVIDYLVKGNKDLVTRKEVILFLEICKAQQVNPFAGDVFLVKYTKEDPASIITSRKNAKRIHTPHCLARPSGPRTRFCQWCQREHRMQRTAEVPGACDANRLQKSVVVLLLY